METIRWCRLRSAADSRGSFLAFEDTYLKYSHIGLVNGRIPENFKELPKRQMLAALLITYTTQVMDYNIKRMHGYAAKEPIALEDVVNQICRVVGYTGD